MKNIYINSNTNWTLTETETDVKNLGNDLTELISVVEKIVKKIYEN